MNFKGEDDGGARYESSDTMWKIELDPEVKKLHEELTGTKIKTVGTKEDWYNGSVKYWNEQPATVDGVLGGYEVVHQADSETSAVMIDEFADRISGFNTAVDMGAGIGRIAKTTLIPRFAEVDLVEPAEIQIKKAEANVPQIRKFYMCGMQDFVYERSYDCVWIQWCAMYLTDADLTDFMVRTRDNLTVTD